MLEIALKLDGDDETLNTVKALLLTRLGRYAEAAPLYEKVLFTMDERPRKWRISTRDQAAGCYRHWAQQDRGNRDRESADIHMLRGLETLEKGALLGDIDPHAIARYAHLIEDDLESVLQQGDSQGLERCLRRLGSPKFPGAIKDLKRVGRVQLRNAVVGNAINESLLNELERVSPEATVDLLGSADLHSERKTDGEQVGVVKRLPVGKNFAFVRDNQGNEWFLHRTGFAGSDWEQIREGLAVTFVLGPSKDGRQCCTKATPVIAT